ncbi:MAG: hypothetical protein IPL42_14095 [Saprospiraceae bacterium]|nr:hypothetical protein [Saprospiraceae bacterium]
MDKSTTLKEEAREIFNYLYSLIYNLNKDIKVGIRINNIKTSDFEKDLIKLKGKRFDSIFTPKIECFDDIQLILSKLNEFNIEYKTLFRIIESKKVLKIYAIYYNQIRSLVKLHLVIVIIIWILILIHSFTKIVGILEMDNCNYCKN